MSSFGHAMQLTEPEEIKATLWKQASHPCTRVRWGTAQVIAAKRSRGHLLAQLRELPRWHEVSAVTIERPLVCPTGACDLGEATLDEGGNTPLGERSS